MALAGLVSAALLRALFPYAACLDLLDHPTSDRKHHDAPVPVIGGIAIFTAIVAVGYVAGLVQGSIVYGLAGGGLLVIVGILDDRIALRASTRFGAQTAAALLLTLGGGVTLTSVGDLLGLGPIQLGVFAVPVTLFAMVGVINAFNMIDGIDGLAGGLTLIALVCLLLLAPSIGPLQVLMLITIAALIPYLIDNLQLFGRRGHRVFLGDSGSMLLGYLVVWGLVDTAATPGGIPAVTALWLVALPLMDTFRVMLRRARRGISPFAADSGHLHHMLSAILGSARRALVVMLIAGVLLAAVGIITNEARVPEQVIFLAALLVFAAYLVLTHLARRWLEQSTMRSVDSKPSPVEV
jgi:UDP-GlcNAc:undecaprenyl-phosphate GlcNAc-1-phosphate transferase